MATVKDSAEKAILLISLDTYRAVLLRRKKAERNPDIAALIEKDVRLVDRVRDAVDTGQLTLS